MISNDKIINNIFTFYGLGNIHIIGRIIVLSLLGLLFYLINEPFIYILSIIALISYVYITIKYTHIEISEDGNLLSTIIGAGISFYSPFIDYTIIVIVFCIIIFIILSQFSYNFILKKVKRTIIKKLIMDLMSGILSLISIQIIYVAIKIFQITYLFLVDFKFK